MYNLNTYNVNVQSMYNVNVQEMMNKALLKMAIQL